MDQTKGKVLFFNFQTLFEFFGNTLWMEEEEGEWEMQKVNPTYVEYDELQHFFISIAGQAASAVPNQGSRLHLQGA